jgi:hypothetical protein
MLDLVDGQLDRARVVEGEGVEGKEYREVAFGLGVFFSVMCRYETWSIGRFGVDKALEWRIGRTYFSVAMLSPFLKPHSPFSYVTAIQEGFWEQAVMQLEIEGSCPWSVYN